MKPERIRVMSKQTRIYHRPTCRYVKRIQKRNLLETGVFEAKAFGYQPCLCCNTIEHVYETEQNYLKYFFRPMKLEFSFIKDAVYVKTPISLWKLVYSKQDEKFILFHRNHSKMPVNYEDPSSERFHRQEDCAKANSIAALGKYIYEHDRYREAQQKGEKLTSFTSKRAERLARQSERKAQHRRLDMLFASIEKNNESFRKLSFC